MRHSVSLVLLAARTAFAVQYTVPQSLVAMVAKQDCSLPDDFYVKNFVADSKDGGKTLDTIDFGFLDDSTNVTTPCHFNETSKPIGNPERTPRFACDNPIIQFIWQNGTITLLEGICPGTDGKSDFEVTGSIPMNLTCAEPTSCGGGSMCKPNSTDIQAKFFSVNPVRDAAPDLVLSEA